VGKWIAKKKTPPEYGESPGPIMVACQWNRSSPIGPAEHDDGGSRPKSVSSLLILFNAMAMVVCVCEGCGGLLSSLRVSRRSRQTGLDGICTGCREIWVSRRFGRRSVGVLVHEIFILL